MAHGYPPCVEAFPLVSFSVSPFSLRLSSPPHDHPVCGLVRGGRVLRRLRRTREQPFSADGYF